MPNEIRPCTLWGQTFDAIGASVLPSGRDMGVYTKDNRVGNFAGTWKLNRGSWGLMDFGLEDCGIYKVKAKEDDPKTAEYLRQFTLDGVRIKEGV